MECAAGVLEAVARCDRIDRHAADRVGRGVSPPFPGPPLAREGEIFVVHDLRTYTPPGYGNKMHDATKQNVAARLKRIEGQVRGVLRMVEDDRYCVDVLTQIDAVRAALHKVEEQILRDHVSHCVAGAFVVRRSG